MLLFRSLYREKGRGSWTFLWPLTIMGKAERTSKSPASAAYQRHHRMALIRYLSKFSGSLGDESFCKEEHSQGWSKEQRLWGRSSGRAVGRTFIAGSSTTSHMTPFFELDSLSSSVTSSCFLAHMGRRAVLTSPQVNKFWVPIETPLSCKDFNLLPASSQTSISKVPLLGKAGQYSFIVHKSWMRCCSRTLQPASRGSCCNTRR